MCTRTSLFSLATCLRQGSSRARAAPAHTWLRHFAARLSARTTSADRLASSPNCAGEPVESGSLKLGRARGRSEWSRMRRCLRLSSNDRSWLCNIHGDRGCVIAASNGSSCCRRRRRRNAVQHFCSRRHSFRQPLLLCAVEPTRSVWSGVMRRISLFFPSLTNLLPSPRQHLIMYHSCILPFHFAPHPFPSNTLFVASKEFCLVFVFRSLSISLRQHTLFPVVLPKVRSLCSLSPSHIARYRTYATHWLASLS